MTKSTLLNVTVPLREPETLNTKFLFSWVRESIRYLGVAIPYDLLKLYPLSYQAILNKTLASLRSWLSGRHSRLGRVALVKMDLLPRWLYLFRALPIAVPRALFLSLRSAVMRYVWANSPPRIRFDVWMLPKCEGELGLSNFEIYQRAAQLSRIMDWLHDSGGKNWRIGCSLYHFSPSHGFDQRIELQLTVLCTFHLSDMGLFCVNDEAYLLCGTNVSDNGEPSFSAGEGSTYLSPLNLGFPVVFDASPLGNGDTISS